MKIRFLSVLSITLLYFIVLGIILTVPVYSQTTGKIVGTVTDASNGELLPGVNVSIVGTNMGAATDLEGYYTIVNVPAGTYDVRISMMGYKKVTKTGVRVSVDQIAVIDFSLESEVIEGEEVVVVAERDILHKEVSNSQQVVTGAQMVEAAGIRTVNHYLEKQPGITGANHLEIRGGSADQTGAIVNGLSFVNPRIGRADAAVPVSAVEQVSLITGGFNAEYGNYRSGLINITTKSGDKSAYHGTFSYTRNEAQMKRFGPSLYDPNSYGLRPYMDPIVSFEGTGLESWLKVTAGDTAEAEYLAQSYDQFRYGWIDQADRFNRGREPEDQATPMDLYLWSAWMHQAVPDFAKLEELYPQWTTEDPDWDKKKQAIKDHSNEEGTDADYNFDGGFGGPVPFIGKYLGDATFYLSNQTNNINYIQPVSRKSQFTTTTLLTLKSQISKSMSLNMNGVYRLRKGIAPVHFNVGQMPTLEQGGGMMFENNIDMLQSLGAMYYWHPTMFHPKDQTTVLAGFKLNNLVNSTTFWDLSFQYGWSKDHAEPKYDRDFAPIINFGPIWLDEMPYGRWDTSTDPDTVRNPDDPSDYFAHGEFEAPQGINRRFNSKTGEYHENSVTQQLRVKFDLSSQVTRAHFVKTGAELNYFGLNNDLWTWWPGHDTNYEIRFDRKPWILGGYIQDQLTLEGMVATIGLRFDYYNSGGGEWPTGDRFNDLAFTPGTEGDNPTLLYERLESGEYVTWNRWKAIDDSLGGTLLEKTKNYFAVSPRLGVSFPVTEKSKFYFNYGHFRSTPRYTDMYMYAFRFWKQGLYGIGNPNLEPPRTIQYELGLSYNLLDQYLINLSTYYKDVTGQSGNSSDPDDFDDVSGNFRYTNSGGSASYMTFMNNEYEDIQGFEVNVNKQYGDFLTGWITYRYMIEKNGHSGREELFSDDIQNETEGLYQSEEDRPTTRPVITGNFSFHTPDDWGPSMLNHHYLGGWLVSCLGRWERGRTFTWNPENVRNLSDNLRWPDYYRFDLKVSRRFSLFGFNANFYIDVYNLFNTKTNWMYEQWCFRNDNDRRSYLTSLQLPMYKDKEIYSGDEYVTGDDKPGDMRADDKSHINDPDNKMWLYGKPRDIWFGIKISF